MEQAQRTILAQQLYEAFETSTRFNGDSYVCLKDGSPAWMQTVVHAAHGDMMPDDWRYQAIHDVAELLAETDSVDDIDLDSLVSVYSLDLLQWVSSSLYRMAYCDDAMQDTDLQTLSDVLMRGQYMEYSEILDQLTAALDAVETE